MKIPALFVCIALAAPMALTGQIAEQEKPSGTSPQISIEAQHFLDVLAKEDQSEIDLANLALSKTSNPQVKAYAKSKILAADPEMERQAKAIAQQNHAPMLAIPSTSSSAEQYYLSKLSGKDFDKAYMAYEDQKQAADLIMVKNEIKTAKNPQIRQFAQKVESPVQQAAQSANEIAQAIE
jgi:putative membrane protein